MATTVRERRFREDLYHRLNVLEVSLPPLRARRGDILDLAAHFLNRLSHQYRRAPKTLSAAAVRALIKHDWPGNVRELENRLHRSFLMADGVRSAARISSSTAPNATTGLTRARF